MIESGKGKTLNYEQAVREMMPEIRRSVRAVCRLYKYSADRDESEDLCQQVVLLLIEEDYRRLRSFDRKKASLKTWLGAVVKNYVSRYVQKQGRSESLEESIFESFIAPPIQEKNVISAERQRSLRKAIKKLSRRERQLYELLCRDDLKISDVAEQMGIKVSTARRSKHDLIEKLRKLVEDRGSRISHSKTGKQKK